MKIKLMKSRLNDAIRGFRPHASRFEWTGTVSDLVEISFILWQSGMLENKKGVNPSLEQVCKDVFTHYGLKKPAHPFNVVTKLRKRNDVEGKSLCWQKLFKLYSIHKC
jgi:hypothetical protein